MSSSTTSSRETIEGILKNTLNTHPDNVIYVEKQKGFINIAASCHIWGQAHQKQSDKLCKKGREHQTVE